MHAQDIIFLHIPKTGGTSLRRALAASAPRDFNLLDYGPDAPETSQSIIECIYAKNKTKLRSKIGPDSSVAISGHLQPERYEEEFPKAALITFIRHPVAQVLSHYRHHSLRLGYKGDLETFCRDPQHQNIQTKFAGRFPLTRFAFIGVLEWYASDVVKLSEIFGAKVPVLHLNKLVADAPPTLTATDVALIEECNRDDMGLYASVVAYRCSQVRPAAPGA